MVLASDTTTNPATTAMCTFTFLRTGEFTNDNKHLEPVISTNQRKEKNLCTHIFNILTRVINVRVSEI